LNKKTKIVVKHKTAQAKESFIVEIKGEEIKIFAEEEKLSEFLEQMKKKGVDIEVKHIYHCA